MLTDEQCEKLWKTYTKNGITTIPDTREGRYVTDWYVRTMSKKHKIKKNHNWKEGIQK
jgi:hypothetical protein